MHRYRLTAPNTPSAPRVARDMLTGVLRATGHTSLVDDARVCVSDLVTNVVQHTAVPDVHVDVTVDADRIVVGVGDDDPCGSPRVREPHPDEEGGRGLLLVQRLSHGAGVAWADGDRAKRVWFELREA